MSNVTNFILTTMIEDQGIKSFNDAVLKLFYGRPTCSFIQVDGHCGGYKSFECDVFLFAGNYADTDDMIDIFKNNKWEYPDDCQLFIKEQEESLFDIFNINTPKPVRPWNIGKED